jgi:hypothetical protein
VKLDMRGTRQARATKKRGKSQRQKSSGCALVLFLLLVIGCGKPLAETSSPAELRVLFIGNSLTYTNDLPAIVQALAESSGKGRLVYQMIALPNYSLEDHWNQGDARRAIAEGKWNFVVLQQGPSALPESRALLVEYTRRFAAAARSSGAQTALYMVWPSQSRLKDFDGVRDSYALAAEEVSGMLFPAGEAWRAAWRHKPELALYSPDGLHPTIAGSYLAAAVICQQLYGQPSITLPASLKLRSKTVSTINLSKEEAELLQAATTEATAHVQRR